jgi:hypothetical protein
MITEDGQLQEITFMILTTEINEYIKAGTREAVNALSDARFVCHLLRDY